MNYPFVLPYVPAHIMGWRMEGIGRWNHNQEAMNCFIIIIVIIIITITIIITRPKRAFGRLGLGGSSGVKTMGKGKISKNVTHRHTHIHFIIIC